MNRTTEIIARKPPRKKQKSRSPATLASRRASYTRLSRASGRHSDFLLQRISVWREAHPCMESDRGGDECDACYAALLGEEMRLRLEWHSRMDAAEGRGTLCEKQ